MLHDSRRINLRRDMMVKLPSRLTFRLAAAARSINIGFLEDIAVFDVAVTISRIMDGTNALGHLRMQAILLALQGDLGGAREAGAQKIH